MFALRWLTLAAALSPLVAQDAKSDPRLSIHTLVREDLFAGYMVNDMERLERGEKTLADLLATRPDDRADLLAWRAATELYRAVRAHEAKDAREFQKRYQSALATYAEAGRLGPDSIGVAAVGGASRLLFGDRLPDAAQRSPLYEEAWAMYNAMWAKQGPGVEKLPVHIKGELLAGLTVAAQRTGRASEAGLYLDKMLTLLAGTPYEARAKRWKEQPEVASRTTLVCQSCHEPGRLEATRARLDRQRR
ncbi:MAG TPA: hypothetical protein DEH78_10230 [Solibacterales bacterium]|nr:hypothetical protein [Bryobacterales bacterium]